MVAIGLIVVLALVGLIVTAMRSGSSASIADGGPRVPARLSEELRRWMEAGLLSRAQAEALAKFEAARVRGSRRGLIVEVVGYLGAVLAAAGAGVALGQAWGDLRVWQRLATSFGTAGAFLVAGIVLSRLDEPAIRRLVSVLWTLSVASLAWGLIVLGVDVLELAEERMSLFVGGVSLAYAGALWWVRRWPGQQVATFLALQVTVAGAILAPSGEAPGWAPMLAIWAVGAAWLVLGWRGLLAPSAMAPALGALAMVLAPTFGGGMDWNVLLGLGTSAGLMVLSVPMRETLLLAIGSVGAFGYLVGTAVTYFGETLGVPLALLFAGLAVLAVAVLGGRLLRLTRRPSGRP